MTASLSGVFSPQFFTDAGLLSVGGRLYTYSPGTTTQKVAYTDTAASVSHTYTSDGIGGLYIGLNARGELPSSLFLTSGGYDLCLKTAAGATVWTRYARGQDDASSAIDTALRADLINTTDTTKGAALVGWLRAAASAVAATVQNRLSWLPFSAFEFMTVAQIADARAYTYTLDLTAPLQVAMNAAYTAGRELHIPAGGYKVTGLAIPGTNNNAGKAHRFRIYGDGWGEAGVIALKNSGSVLYSVTNAPILNYTATVAGTGNGEVEIDHLLIYGTSAVPVISMDTFYGLSSIHHINLAQSGTGNGIQINFGATYDIHRCYITGASYTAINLGAARTGVGVYIAQGTNSAGLQAIRQCTVAGWNTCIQLGVSGGAFYVYAPFVSNCETSYCYKGIWLTDRCESATVSQTYFEGQDAGYCVLDDGNYNRVKDCFFFFSSGSLSAYTMLSSTAASKFGSRYEGNTFYLFNVTNTVGIDISSNAVNGGPGKVASRNHFVLFAGTAGVIGLRTNGVDPRIETASNDFQPAGAWTGTGTYKISNTSTSSDGTTGNAVYGLTQGQSLAGALTVPAIGRGAMNLAVEPTALNNTNIAAGVLTLGELSAYTLTPTVGVAVTSFSAPNLPDKTFSIHVTATAFAVTFTNGALLKLAGSANFVTGANGGWISFQIKPGGIAYETARVVY